MKKIIICCGNLKAGGAERVISILANKLTQYKIQVQIYTWYKTDIFYNIDKSINIIQIPIESGSSILHKQMLWFRHRIKNEMPDIVLSFLAPFNILTIFSLLGNSIPVIVAERNDPNYVSPSNNWFWKIIRNIAYKMADGILVQTEVNKSHFPRYLQRKSTVIFNPVTFTEEYIGLAQNQEKRKEIVSVTRLEKQKNIEMLIRAFAQFKKSHNDYILIIYGEGRERNNLNSLIEQLELTDSIYLPGRKKDIHERIIGASIFAMSSNYEGMSNSLIEAMCLGLPCISTRVSGATDLISDKKNGLLVDINNQDGMYKSLCCLADNPKFAQTLGKEASKIYELLNVDIVVDQWVEYMMKSTIK